LDHETSKATSESMIKMRYLLGTSEAASATAEMVVDSEGT